MIPVSLLLILVAVALLALGLTGGSSGLLIASIVASLLAAVALVVGARRNAGARRAATATSPGARPAPAPAPGEPAASYASGPSAEYATEPGAEYATEPGAEYATEPGAEYVTEPSAGYAAEPSGEYVAEPGAEFATEPSAAFTAEPPPGFAGATPPPGFADATPPPGFAAAAPAPGFATGAPPPGFATAAPQPGFATAAAPPGEFPPPPPTAEPGASGEVDLGLDDDEAPWQTREQIYTTQATPESEVAAAAGPDYDRAASAIHAARSGQPDANAWRRDSHAEATAHAGVNDDFAEPDADDPDDEPLPQAVQPADAVRVARMDAEVLVVDGRPRYHMADCAHLVGRLTEPIPVNEAVELGFSPCGLCRPVDRLVAAAARR
jgi:clumping factor A